MSVGVCIMRHIHQTCRRIQDYFKPYKEGILHIRKDIISYMSVKFARQIVDLHYIIHAYLIPPKFLQMYSVFEISCQNKKPTLLHYSCQISWYNCTTQVHYVINSFVIQTTPYSLTFVCFKVDKDECYHLLPPHRNTCILQFLLYKSLFIVFSIQWKQRFRCLFHKM